MIPHVLLATPIVASVYFLPDMLAEISQGYVLLVVSLLYPISNSIYSIEKSSVPNTKNRCLMYWVVFSVISFVHAVIPYVPFATRLFGAIPFLQELSFVFFIWLQLPWTDGSIVMYNYVIPFINKYLQRVSKPKILNSFNQNAEQQNFIIRLVINTIVPDKYRNNVLEILFQSGYLLCGFIFFFLPSYFAGLGCIIIGIGFPYYSSITILGLQKQSARENNEIQDKIVWWLKYWVVYFSFSYLHDGITVILNLEYFPFWYQIKLFIIYWLQLPISYGAITVYEKVIPMIFKILHKFGIGTVQNNIVQNNIVQNNNTVQNNIVQNNTVQNNISDQ